MTEILLNAVINLFSIQASMLDEATRPAVRGVLERYLRQHLRLVSCAEYLELYDTAQDLHALSDDAVRLDHARGVAGGLKSLLPRREQFVLMLRYLESVATLDSDEAALAVAEAVATELSIPQDRLVEMRTLCTAPFDHTRLTLNFLIKTDSSAANCGNFRHLPRPDFEGDLTVLHLPEAGASFAVAGPDSPISLDSIAFTPGSPQLLQPGGILRDIRGNRIYHAEIMAALKGEAECGSGGLVFEGQGLNFRYPGSENGLHDFTFRQRGGALVGVMGASGAGKSTLLGILNGQMPPDSGQVLINGMNLHTSPDMLEGVVGYVPQDDLLFEDLTVFDNLYYSASLCLARLSGQKRRERVENLLEELHQGETGQLKVGTPLDKTISGGQRKRLNIALELIREPSILFVDEPTSGLSSADSENVMALLKAQAAKGRLVIVVIHQPSSRIYKMFDTLWVLDQGGRPIYDGNPLDAIVHFRSEVHQAGMEEYACPNCGQVNPEQLFEIIEARSLGEDGQYSRERRISAAAWHQRYLSSRQDTSTPKDEQDTPQKPEKRLWRPTLAGQFAIFFMRTLKGRLANRQYLAVNALEPPLLAFLAALISHGAWGGQYVFMDNQNLGTYFFIAVIVALFLGLSVSAEEICRDRKILRREAFLHLSWPAYVASKTTYLLLVAAVQTALIACIGNAVLGIKGMYLATWLVLFSCSAASSLLGLNISATLKSAVTIYILIPLLLVPQMMLGGAVIPMDQLLHREAGHRNTPLAANLMPARWGYEALVVDQYLNNAYTRLFLPALLQREQAAYEVNHLLPELRALADYPLLQDKEPGWKQKAAKGLAILADELPRLAGQTGVPFDDESFHSVLSRLEPGSYTPLERNEIKRYLKRAGKALHDRRKQAHDSVKSIESRLRKNMGADALRALKRTHYNQEIANTVMNVKGLEFIRRSGTRLVQISAPIAQTPQSPFGGAQLMAARKRLGDQFIPTYAFNLAVLWLMGLLLYAALYFKLFPMLLKLMGRTAALFTREHQAHGIHTT